MRQPSIDVLIEKTDSKYALVVAAAKRARMITDGSKPLISIDYDAGNKAVSVALEEIGAGKIYAEAPKGGIK